MIKINKSIAPNCLTELKVKPDATYNDLQNPCKSIVQEQLKTEQKNLCAYCQRKFNSAVFIEHYVPQSIDNTKQLDYNNFLGVCSGQYYLDRKTGKSIRFCSVNRGNQDLTINPINQNDIDTIFYNENFQICSTDVIFQNELNVILNLNFDDLCIDREIAYEKELNAFFELAEALELDNPIELFSKAIRSVAISNPEFSGLLIYKFKEQLQFYENR